MNTQIIIGGLILIGFSLIFLFPGLLLKIASFPVIGGSDLTDITGRVAADNTNTQSNNFLSEFKDSLKVINSIMSPVFSPFFIVGIITLIVGLKVK